MKGAVFMFPVYLSAICLAQAGMLVFISSIFHKVLTLWPEGLCIIVIFGSAFRTCILQTANFFFFCKETVKNFAFDNVCVSRLSALLESHLLWYSHYIILHHKTI